MTTKSAGLSAASAVLIGGAVWYGSVSTRQDTVVPLRIETRSVPDGTCGEPYRAVIQVSGGKSPYRFNVVEGALPGWMSLQQEGNTAVLSGTPPAAGPDGTCGGPVIVAGTTIQFRTGSWKHARKTEN